MKLTIEAIYISSEHNFFGHYGQAAGTAPTIGLEEAQLVAGKGIVGDRFFDYKSNYKGQVTFFSCEVFDDVSEKLSFQDQDAAVFRRNIIVRGGDLNALIGQEFEIQGVRFLGMAECSPCEWLDLVCGPGTEAALKGRGGLRAQVLTDGVLRRDG